MYFSCIRFIKQMKPGIQFGASSPVLNDISGVPEWSKVATGLFLMFQDEVLWSVQIMQHIKFGTLLPINY
jgi:serine/threonine-protein phosphatase 2A activator